jgi:hypothetical protein
MTASMMEPIEVKEDSMVAQHGAAGQLEFYSVYHHTSGA